MLTNFATGHGLYTGPQFTRIEQKTKDSSNAVVTAQQILNYLLHMPLSGHVLIHNKKHYIQCHVRQLAYRMRFHITVVKPKLTVVALS